MEAAQAALSQIEEQILEDAYIIQNSDSGILISLGVYSELVRADNLARSVEELGFAATTTDRMRMAEVVWIEFDQTGSSAETLDLLQELSGETLEQRDCAAGL